MADLGWEDGSRMGAYVWGLDCYRVMLLTGRKTAATYSFYESVGFDRNVKQVFMVRPR